MIVVWHTSDIVAFAGHLGIAGEGITKTLSTELRLRVPCINIHVILVHAHGLTLVNNILKKFGPSLSMRFFFAQVVNST